MSDAPFEIEWESSDDDIRRMRNEISGREGSKSPLPFQFHRIERPVATNAWKKHAAKTIYRFTGDLRVKTTVSSTGYEFIDLIPTGQWRQQLMINLWNDLGNISTDELPNYLRNVPVKAFGPLTKAAGLYRGDKADRFLLPSKNQRGEMTFKHHREKGVIPTTFYWASAMVTHFMEAKDGSLESFEYPAIVVFKKWQFEAFANWLQNRREAVGPWSLKGVPLHIQDMKPPPDKPSTTTKLKVAVLDDSEAVYGDDKLPEISFGEMAISIYNHLDAWLVANDGTIKDFPKKGAHPEGWDAEFSLYEQQYQQYLSGAGKAQSDEEVDQDDPPFETASTGNGFHSKSDEELTDLLKEFGIPIPRRKTRDRMIALLEAQTNG